MNNDPLGAPRLLPGQFRAPPVDLDEEAADEGGKPAGSRVDPRRFVVPPDPLSEDEQAVLAGKPASFFAPNPDYVTTRKKGEDYDRQVADAWSAYQDQTGVPTEHRTQYPGDYLPYGIQAWDPSVTGKPLNHLAELKPDEPPPAGQPTGESSAPPEAPPAPRPQPTPSRGGGGGGPAAPDYAGRLQADFDERLKAMQDEIDARKAGSASVSESLGRAADVERGNAQASAEDARLRAEAARAKQAEVQQLVNDYASGHIDDRKWWTDKTVPQRIAMVIGTMLSGAAGGLQGAMQYVHSQVDRSVALQQDALKQKYNAAAMSENLLGSFMRTSENEQEAVDKARAALYGAAMIDVQKAAVAAKGPEEAAQIQQLMADMKAARDGALAKLAAQAHGGAGVSPQGLSVDPNMIVHTADGSFLVPKGDAENIRQRLDAYDQLEDSIRSGLRNLANRDVTDRVNPWSSNVSEGATSYGLAMTSLARLESARGIPPSVAKLAHEMLPDFGSRTTVASRDIPKAQRLLQLVQQQRQNMLQNANAQPVDLSSGPGQGKKAGEWTYYATPRAPGQGPADAAPPDRPAPSFQPR